MMNVLIITASPWKKGIITILINQAETVISPSHHVKIFRIRNLCMEPCIGCLKYRSDKTFFLPRNDGHILAEKIKKSDLLILFYIICSKETGFLSFEIRMVSVFLDTTEPLN